MKHYRSILMCVFVLLTLPCALLFPQQKISWQAWDASGAGRSLSGTVQIYSSFGQSAVGVGISNSYLIKHGYLQGSIGSSDAPTIVAQSSVNFGDVLVGNPATQALTVQNGGTAPLIISAMTIAPAVYSILSGGGPQTISSGGSVTLQLQFQPTATGAMTGTLTIDNNSASNPNFTVTLNGTGVLGQPDLRLSTMTLDFGSVPVLTSHDMELDVENVGMSNLEISQQMIGGADSLHFSIQQAAPSSIAASGSSTMRIRHLPISGGSKRAVLKLYSNDPDLPVAEVVLMSVVTGVKRLPQQPTSIRLHQNYPNPFNPTTTLEYEIDEACEISLTVHDVHGRLVSTLDNKWREAGVYRVDFDAAHCPSGAYIAVLHATGPSGTRTERIRMILAK